MKWARNVALCEAALPAPGSPAAAGLDDPGAYDGDTGDGGDPELGGRM